MAELLLVIMLVAATLYAVLGGADFGVGILEPLLDRKYEKQIDAALSPVWEANHVWLVLVAVIAFVGFPVLFSTLSTYLHIPLLFVLLGIVARGSAFTFRHYDPEAGALRPWYSWAFRLGSLLTPLFLGVIVAAWLQGVLADDLTRGAYALYVAPWNTPFCWASGLFVCALFAFQGAALLAAEQAKEHGPLPLLRTARRLHLLAMGLGAVVFVCAYASGLPWLRAWLAHPITLGCLLTASLLTPLVALSFRRGWPWRLRLLVGGQVSCVLVGLYAAQHPVLLRMRQRVWSLHEVVAGPATLRSLLVTLLIGLLLIVPSLVYLLRVYKLSAKEPR
jgi:cytochrome bd ubiquinol oxidase subunit II